MHRRPGIPSVLLALVSISVLLTWGDAGAGIASPLPGPDSPASISSRGSDLDLQTGSASDLRTHSSAGIWKYLLPTLARAGHTAILDPVRHRVIVFGGYDGVGHGDVWAIDLSAPSAWTPIATVGSGPPARYEHVAIYDPLRDRMIVHGGVGSPGDTWALSLSGTPEWSLITASGPARSHHTAIYDPIRDRMIVFGGEGPTGAVGDVWTLDLAGASAWVQQSPAGTIPAMSEHVAIYDPASDRMIVTRGDQAWGLTLSGGMEWTSLPASGLGPPVLEVSGIYDPVRQRMVVVGRASPSGTFLAWSLSLTNYLWLRHDITGPILPRRGHATIYDTAADRMVIVAGRGQTDLPVYRDLWTLPFAGSSWVELPLTYYPLTPGPRVGHTAVYDSLRDRMIIFGGLSLDGTARRDLWALELSPEPHWIELHPGGGTGPWFRTQHTAIYDPTGDRMIVFGGNDGTTRLGDLWELRLSPTLQWAPLLPGGTKPTGRFGPTAVFDPSRRRMIVFGGYDGAYQNDVWSFDLAGTPSWSKLSPTGTPPPGRYRHAAIWDPIRNRMIIQGGTNNVGLSDAWELRFPPTPTAPQWIPMADGFRVELHRALYDPPRDRMVVSVWNSAWSLDLANPTVLTPLQSTGEPFNPRVGHSAVYDSRRQRMIVHGGFLLAGFQSDETWTLNWEEDAPTAVALSLVTATTDGDAVQLRWQSRGGPLDARLQRRTDTSGWIEIARIRSDGEGFLFYEDRDVEAATRYAYRLEFESEGDRSRSDVVWVTVPSASSLSLAGLQPNPADRELVVSFSLATREPTRIDLVDLAGRSVLSRVIEDPAPGSQRIRLGDAGTLSAGVYWIRVTQGRSAISRKACVVH